MRLVVAGKAVDELLSYLSRAEACFQADQIYLTDKNPDFTVERWDLVCMLNRSFGFDRRAACL